MLVVTTNDLPGYRVVQVIGLVKGITVRSRSVIGSRCLAATSRSTPNWPRQRVRKVST